MSRRRKRTIRTSGWMQAVMFNSLLILMPVIAAQTLGHVYSGVSITDTPKVEAIDHTRRNMDDAFAAMAPRNGGDRMRYWSDIISRELSVKDASAARGFLLAAPEMLDRDSVKELRAAADSERGGSRDERLANAALRKLPYDVGEKYEAISGASNVMNTIPSDASSETDTETTEEENLPPEVVDVPAGDSKVSISVAQSENNSQFRLLGTYADLANNTERWLENDRIDPLVLKITAIGLIQTDSGDGLAGATLRAASILKSARRSRRMTEGFANHIERRINEALPDDALRAALEENLSSGLLPTDVRVERVRLAYISAIDPHGMRRLEQELDQIDRLGGLTSPAAAITLLEVVTSGSDLRRARLIAEAGGDRAVALVKQSEHDALRLADNGVRLTLRVVLQLMGLTAASLAMLFLMLSTLRRNFRRQMKMEVI